MFSANNEVTSGRAALHRAWVHGSSLNTMAFTFRIKHILLLQLRSLWRNWRIQVHLVDNSGAIEFTTLRKLVLLFTGRIVIIVCILVIILSIARHSEWPRQRRVRVALHERCLLGRTSLLMLLISTLYSRWLHSDTLLDLWLLSICGPYFVLWLMMTFLAFTGSCYTLGHPQLAFMLLLAQAKLDTLCFLAINAGSMLRALSCGSVWHMALGRPLAASIFDV